MKLIRTVMLSMSLIASASASATLIYNEDFSGSAGSLVSAGWSDSDNSNGLELYRTNSASPRGMVGVYDHDNNPFTPDVAIVGALEVNDDAGNVQLMSEIFVMDQSVFSWEVGTLSFFAGVRKANAQGASVEVFNVTQNYSLTGLLTPALNPTAPKAKNTWSFNSFSFLWGNTQQGDELQLRFNGGGSTSANGLQIADIALTKVPTPGPLLLLGLGIIGLALGKRRQ
ncbi:hypothetical protein DRW07_07460 [Alteromonas sediminis]|uniref:PEP-CTERM sorting domain-containing protein n=1 Tax=Alteromonas sediminis TaxID=2259342 RepID=A0A3N5Y0V3_9ALTE|nr:hypothetical protein [Alteromonas sediminis]RPJ67357.1 hypothetical protein DRW07_07460 [Alteromonas sediminis]